MSLILCSSASDEIKFWDSTCGKYLFTIQNAHNDLIQDMLFFSPKYLITASKDFSVRAFNLESKRHYKSFLKHHYNHVNTLHMFKENQSFLSAGSDRKVILWKYNKDHETHSDIPMFTTEEICKKFEIVDTAESFVSMCNWNASIVAVGGYNRITLFDVFTKKQFHRLDFGYSVGASFINRMKFSNHTNLLYCVSDSGSMFVFDPRSKKAKKKPIRRNMYNWGYQSNVENQYNRYLKKRLYVNKMRKRVFGLDVNDKYVITGDGLGIIKIWDHRNQDVCVHTIKAHSFQINDVAFTSQAGMEFYSSSWDTTIKYWDNEGKIKQVINGHKLGANRLYYLRRKANDYIAKKDVFIERIEFMDENEFFDFEIKLKNKTLSLFKSLLMSSKLIEEHDMSKIKDKKEEEEEEGEGESDSESDDDEIESIFIDKSLSVDENVLQKILFGYWIEIKEEEYVDYFVLFKELKMKKYMLVLLQELKYFGDEKVLIIFEKCVKVFNESAPDNNSMIKFNSSLTLSCFNVLYSKYQKTYGPKILNKMKELKFEKEFTKFKFKSVYKHKDIDDEKIKAGNYTFELLFKETLLELFKCKKYCNAIVETKDGKHIPVHLEVLIMRNSFFFSLYNFRGSEFEALKKNKIVKVDILNHEQVFTVLEFIYMNKVIKYVSDPFVLLNVIEFAEMFFSHDLKSHLIYMLVRIIQKQTVEYTQIINRINKFPKMLQAEIKKIVSFEKEKIEMQNVGKNFRKKGIKKHYKK